MVVRWDRRVLLSSPSHQPGCLPPNPRYHHGHDLCDNCGQFPLLTGTSVSLSGTQGESQPLTELVLLFGFNRILEWETFCEVYCARELYTSCCYLMLAMHLPGQKLC